MDRVTRYPIFSNPHSARVTGLALDEDTSYTVELVGVGPEAGCSQGGLQAWSTEYQTRPDVRRTSLSSTRHVFLGQQSPRPLYLEDEDEEMKAYHLDDSSDALGRQRRDLEAERCAVIQSQAVRKGGTVATLQAASHHRDPGIAGQPQSTFTEEILVDTEQIDFLAARQQFLSLEKANTNPVMWSPTARETFARTPPGINQAPKASTGPHLANGYAVSVMSPMKEVILEESLHVSPARSICTANDPDHQTRAESPETPKETPIEREIRLAQEREAELRQQRGLGRAAGHQELVQIPSRPLLSKMSLTETPPRRDRGRPSLYVQRDMVQGTQREEDHRREGLQVGRASTPDWPAQDPQPGLLRSLSSDCILSPDARAADPAPEARKVNRIPPDAYQPYLGPGTPKLEFSAFGVYSKPSGVSTEDTKATAFQKAMESPRHVSESSGRSLSSKQERSKPPGKPAGGGVVRLENFHLRPLQFKAPDVSQEAETSHTWGWEVAGGPVLRLQKSQSSDLLEREMESVLQREREVAEERRNAFFPEVFSPVLDQEESHEQDSRSSSRASGEPGFRGWLFCPEGPWVREGELEGQVQTHPFLPGSRFWREKHQLCFRVFECYVIRCIGFCSMVLNVLFLDVEICKSLSLGLIAPLSKDIFSITWWYVFFAHSLKSFLSGCFSQSVTSCLSACLFTCLYKRSRLLSRDLKSPGPSTDSPLSRMPPPSALTTGITGSYSVSETPLFKPIHLHSGLVWKVEAPEDSAPPGQKTRKEMWVSRVD